MKFAKREFWILFSLLTQKQGILFPRTEDLIQTKFAKIFFKEEEGEVTVV